MHRPGPPHRPRSPLPSPRRRLRPTGHSRPSPVQDSEDTPRPPQSPRLTCVSAAGRRSGRTCWGSNPHPHPHAHRLRVAASQTGSAYCEMVGGVSLGSQSDGGVANTASSVPLPRPALPRPPPPPPRWPRKGCPWLGLGGAQATPPAAYGHHLRHGLWGSGDSGEMLPWHSQQWVSQTLSLECSPTGWARAVCSAVDGAGLWV